MPRSLGISTVLAIVLAMYLINPISAQDCQRCGCKASTQKMCRLVCEEKRVEITCWGCRDEDFCISGPSNPGCKHHDKVCDCGEGHDPKSPIAQPKKFVWTEWIPGCAKVHTRKKLMKRTVIQTIPSYKWVVEDLCDQCESSLPPVKSDADSAVLPPPKVDAAVKFPQARIAPMK